MTTTPSDCITERHQSSAPSFAGLLNVLIQQEPRIKRLEVARHWFAFDLAQGLFAVAAYHFSMFEMAVTRRWGRWEMDGV
jgi:hypothetical protein